MKINRSLFLTLLAIFYIGWAGNAQSPEYEIVLSQNISLVLLPIGGLACPGGDNQWYREYILDEEGITGPVVLKSVEFGVQAIDATTELQVFAYDYEDFPDGFDISNPPTPLASGTVTVGPSDVGNFVRGSFDIPAVVTENTTVVVSVVQPVDGINFYIGITESETKPSFMSSAQCGPSTPISMVDMGFPDSRHLLNLVVDNELSITEQAIENFKVFPNPVKNILNLSHPIPVNDVAIYDVMGKKLNFNYNDSAINVSSLSEGTYFLKINTGNTVLTRRFLKE